MLVKNETATIFQKNSQNYVVNKLQKYVVVEQKVQVCHIVRPRYFTWTFWRKNYNCNQKNKAILYEMLLLDFPRGILTWITDKSQQMFSSGMIVDNTVILSKNPN